MENYIDKTIELLQALKENGGIAHTVSIEYGTTQIPSGGFPEWITVRDGSFTIEVNGGNLKVDLDKLKE